MSMGKKTHQLNLFGYEDVDEDNRSAEKYGQKLFDKGTDFFSQKKYEKAIEFYKKAYHTFPETPARLMAAIGNAYLQKAEISQKTQDFYRAYHYYSEAYQNVKDKDTRSAKEIAKESGQKLFDTGIDFFFKEDYEKAIKIYKKVYHIFPKTPARLMASIGNAYLQKAKISKKPQDFYRAYHYYSEAYKKAKGFFKKEFKKTADEMYIVYRYINIDYDPFADKENLFYNKN